MNGFLKVSSAVYDGKTGISIESRMTDIDILNRVGILDGVLQALHIDSIEELAVILGIRDAVKAKNGMTTIKVEAKMPDIDQ